MLESRFQHVLHTNYAPTDADAREIREFCTAPKTEIKQLELEISRLEANLDVVRLQRDKLKDTVAAHRALLSPIRRLSPELLQNIFAFCLAEFPVMHASDAPLLLGRVCKKWRDIVYSTAELWSAVHIAVPSIRHHEQDRLLRLAALKEWLSRSGDHTLRISLYANYAAGDIAAFLDLIIALSPRWERIALVIPSTYFKQLEQSFDGTDPLVHLRTFELGDRLRMEPPSIHLHPGSSAGDPFRLLTLCTKIERISVFLSAGAYSSLWFRALSAVVVNLQELNLNDFRIDDELFGFIGLCQNLRTLRIRNSFHDSAAPHLSITLPMLEHLMVDILGDAPLPNLPSTHLNPLLDAFPTHMFLSHMITPKLRHLEFMDSFDVDSTVSLLNNLFARSSCSLRTLAVRVTGDLNLRHLLSSLDYVNDLQDLTIDLRGTPRRPVSITEQDVDLGPDIYCPNLTYLALVNYAHNPGLTSILTFIRSRIKTPPGCAFLKVLDLESFISSWNSRVHLLETMPVDTALISFVQSAIALREQGLEVLLPPNPLPSVPLLSPRAGLPHPFINSFKL